MLPPDFPRWEAVYHQTQRWLQAGAFAALVPDRRALLRGALGRTAPPAAVSGAVRTRPATPESGRRAGYAGHQRKKGSQTHRALDTLGHVLALVGTPATAHERAQVRALAQQVQAVTGAQVELAFADQGDGGEDVAAAAQMRGIHREVVKLPAAKRGFVRLPRRWVGERSCAWAARFRRLAPDDERLPQTLIGLHFVAFVGLLLHRAGPFLPVHHTL